MLQLTVNGRTAEVDVDAATPLIYVLRNDLALNGPKLGCGRAQCGAGLAGGDDGARRAHSPIGQREHAAVAAQQELLVVARAPGHGPQRVARGDAAGAGPAAHVKGLPVCGRSTA